jgi:hypothetical protein
LFSHKGATWQATKDTSREPGHHGDWALIAAAGEDARTPEVRGTYDPTTKYNALDIVALNGGSFVARKNDPGTCPGDDWQMVARQGQRGVAGEKGDRGEKGPQGEAGITIRSWTIDRKTYVATPVLTDGTLGPTLQLASLFEQFQIETG